jgi:hypothetical protein
MKIAIYGDSFASTYQGWPKCFEKLTKGKVDIFARAGTSVGYSYLKFLETHEKYDYVLFFWTQPTRSWLISDFNNNNILEHYCSFIQSDTLDNIFESQQIYEKRPLTNELKNWIINEKENSKEYKLKNLINVISMKDSVKLKRPDSFNIDSFDFSKMKKNKILSEKIPGMWRIQLQDMIQFSKIRVFEYPHIRPNHLTLIQNVEFSKYLLKFFEDRNFDIHETFRDPKKYYSMSKTVEESGFIL